MIAVPVNSKRRTISSKQCGLEVQDKNSAIIDPGERVVGHLKWLDAMQVTHALVGCQNWPLSVTVLIDKLQRRKFPGAPILST